jgi:hypothetical protein
MRKARMKNRRKISNGNLTADECRRKLAEITDQVSAIEGAGV